MQWAKSRAVEYCNANDPEQAFASITSDLGKHHETHGHIGIQLGRMQMMLGGLSTGAEMKKFIEGFN